MAGVKSLPPQPIRAKLVASSPHGAHDLKLFMATLLTETNTFSPIPTGRRAYFEEKDFFRNDASRRPPVAHNIPAIVWRR